MLKTTVRWSFALARGKSGADRSWGQVFDDGNSQSLVCLSGVIPVTVSGNVYNCPLALWLPLDYPAQPPLTLILPTNALEIKKSPQVDPNGRVSLPYLQEWVQHRGVSISALPGRTVRWS